MILASFGGLVALALAFGVGALYGWWTHRQFRAELRDELRKGAGIIAHMLTSLPAGAGRRRRPADFVARWQQ